MIFLPQSPREAVNTDSEKMHQKSKVHILWMAAWRPLLDSLSLPLYCGIIHLLPFPRLYYGYKNTLALFLGCLKSMDRGWHSLMKLGRPMSQIKGILENSRSFPALPVEISLARSMNVPGPSLMLL